MWLRRTSHRVQLASPCISRCSPATWRVTWDGHSATQRQRGTWTQLLGRSMARFGLGSVLHSYVSTVLRYVAELWGCCTAWDQNWKKMRLQHLCFIVLVLGIHAKPERAHHVLDTVFRSIPNIAHGLQQRCSILGTTSSQDRKQCGLSKNKRRIRASVQSFRRAP